jgi:hypothetical protein
MITKDLIGQIIITNSKMLKVSSYNKKYIYGYDILTEEFTSIPITEQYLLNPEVLLSLIKEENARFNYINATFPKKTMIYRASILGVSDRTFYRIFSGDYKKREKIIQPSSKFNPENKKNKK